MHLQQIIKQGALNTSNDISQIRIQIIKMSPTTINSTYGGSETRVSKQRTGM